MSESLEQKWDKLNKQYVEHASSLGKDHLVVSAVIIQNNKILVVRRSKNDSYPGMWEFPGGGVDKGETVIEAIRREAKEETNLLIDHYPVTELMLHPTRTALRVVMLFECIDISTLMLSHEHDDHYWMEIDAFSVGSTRSEKVDEIYAMMRSENQSIIEMVAALKENELYLSLELGRTNQVHPPGSS